MPKSIQIVIIIVTLCVTVKCPSSTAPLYLNSMIHECVSEVCVIVPFIPWATGSTVGMHVFYDII